MNLSAPTKPPLSTETANWPIENANHKWPQEKPALASSPDKPHQGQDWNMFSIDAPDPDPSPFFEQAPNSESFVPPANGTGEEVERLHNQLPPNIDIQHERVRHRMLAFLISTGSTQREAAKEMGYSEGWVSQICRQEWFVGLVAEEITKAGRSVVDELFRNAAPGAVLRVIDLSQNAEKDAVKLAANKEILERYLGKSTQTVLHGEAKVCDDPVEEVQRLEAEAQRLRRE
jgi:hypothetical protein